MYKEKELCVICIYVNAELSFRLIIWGFKESLQLDQKRTLPWKTKVICNWSPPPYIYNET
jgi:hypothetical protein